MWKIIGYVVLWSAGSTAAVAVAWTGVSTVDGGIAPPAEARDAAELTSSATTDSIGSSIDGRAGASSSGPPSTEPTVETVEPNANGAVDTSGDAVSAAATPSDDSATTSTRRTTSSTPESGQTTSRSTTSAPNSTSTRNTTTSTPRTTPTSAPATTSTTAPPTTNAPTTTTTTAETRTFQLVGGTTAVSFSAGEIKVLWATPNPGFEVRVAPESPGMKVEFRADHHESRIDVWWSGGPQHDIRERER